MGSWREKLSLLLTSVVPTAVLILAVLGSIFFGVAAVTEAAAVGALASMLLAAMYRRLTFSLVKEACVGTLQITSMIMLIAVAAAFFSTVFVAVGGDDVISKLFLNLPLGKWGILFAIMLLLVVLGALIDWISIVFILVPADHAHRGGPGVRPGLVRLARHRESPDLLPHAALCLFDLLPERHRAAGCEDHGHLPGRGAFCGAPVLCLILCTVFPGILTWLPGLMIK